MGKRTILIAGGALMALAVAAGCSSNAGDSADQQSPAAPPPTTTSAASEASANPAAHNDADVMFTQHMIPHHQQAIEMSDMLNGKQGIDPRVTQLADQIKAAQGPEIDKMRNWLHEWGNPPMPPMSSMPAEHGDMPAEHGDMPDHGNMPGMAHGQGIMSDEDMTALRNAQGVEAGKLFLSQMIEHHQGAIDMAQKEIKDGQYRPAVDMAHSIVTSQQKEIDTMKGLLGSL